MLVKFLGVIDIIGAFIAFINIDLPRAFLIIPFFIIIKGALFGFGGDFVSWIDVFCGVVLSLSFLFHFPVLIMLFIAGFLGIKGLVSLGA